MSNKPDNEQDADGVLGRWSRRKVAARAGDTPPEPADQPVTTEPPADTEADDARPTLTDEDMPAIDTLKPDSDVSGFLSPGVSDALRRKALRALFHTSRFNVKDGLDDYDDDYTLLQPLGDTMTHDLRRQNDRLAERQRIKDEQAAAESETAAEPSDGLETEAPSESLAVDPAPSESGDESGDESLDPPTNDTPEDPPRA